MRTQFYKGEVSREAFSWAQSHTRLPLCYNGDLFAEKDVASAPQTPLMFGRGLVADPALLRRLRGGAAASAAELQAYHDRLYEAYRHDFGGGTAALHRMRELWTYLSDSFQNTDALLRGVRKARSCAEYEQTVRSFFSQAELK